MIKAVLLDLDDTLLHYPHGGTSVVGEYMALLRRFFHQETDFTDLSRNLAGIIRKINPNDDPTQSNYRRYWEALGPVLPQSVTPETLENALNRFYVDYYPELNQFSEPIDIVPGLVEGLLERGYQVVIATNPLYPQYVIEMRTRWAGLDPAAFARVTYMENSHFAKPQPHYYEEIMAHIGYEPYEAIMVGDNWRNDIIPAAHVGMRTFWIENRFARPDQSVKPDGQGSLNDFAYQVFEENWLEQLPPLPVKPHHITPRLLANVAALFGMVDTVLPRHWHQRPDPREWTPLEIIAHLAESERTTQRPTLQRIAREDNPFISKPPEPPQVGQWPFGLAADGLSFALEFAKERAQTLDFLAALDPSDWFRPARHSIYGPTCLLEMALLTARHDQLHLQQFCQTLGKCE